MKVRLVMQMSGSRGDGSRWPDPGTVIEVSDAEGAELCRSVPSSPTPIAVPVVEERTETAVPKSAPPEVRAEEQKVTASAAAAAASDAVLAEAEAEEASAPDEPPVQRGPGRPRKNPDA